MARQKIEKDRKIFEDVFDTPTIRSLETMIAKKKISRIAGVIKSGKEGQVHLGFNQEGEPIIIKIYLIETSSFQKMADYIKGDRRFYNIGTDKRRLVYAWCAKEYRNLMKSYDSGLSVPKPIAFANNVLVMELIDEKDMPAPQLSNTEIENPKKMFAMVLEQMKMLYFKANLVHADLSEYNILVKDGKPILIDMGQSVLLKHPMAQKFLERDVNNIVNFFNKKGLNLDPEKILKQFKKKL
ncbi:MAG: serine protein kinase RIO [Candidatus Aenigmarchaeota archaeon]|nr:serine protein kinase RIO [Candidatus Aenigmarchaeota archaeon]